MKKLAVLLSAVLALVLMTETAQAQQQGTIEIGVDNALSFNLVQAFTVESVELAESRTDIDFFLPAFYWRFGYFASPMFSIEIPVGFLLASTGNSGGTDYMLDAGLNVLYNMESGLFLGVNGVLSYMRDDPGGDEESSSTTRYGFGGQVGYRVPFIADNIRFRTALVYNYLLKNEDDFIPAAHRIAAQFGMSLMTK